jgi:hypothetical protein
VSFARLATFRCQVYASFELRADVLTELFHSLPLLPAIGAAVHVSLAPAFRRGFASVYEALRHARIDRVALRAVLYPAQRLQAELIAGYAVWSVDTTPVPRPNAQTMRERSQNYSVAHGVGIPGFKYSFLGRVLREGMSWVAPLEVDRVPAGGSPSEVAGEQVKALAAVTTEEDPEQVVTADSGYATKEFLRAFVGLKRLHALVRLKSRRTLRRQPPAQTPDLPKRNRKHGPKLSLLAPPEPDRAVLTTVGKHPVRISVWLKLHLEEVPDLVGMLIRAEFLKPDGTPRYKRPLWLFWSGPETAVLEDLVHLYHMRYMIEHFFRFLKQRLGLLAFKGTAPEGQDTWTWAVALAYWLLLMGRQLVWAEYHPWDPAARRNPTRLLTPGQVLDAWATFSHRLSDVTESPQPAGKAPGRPPGYKEPKCRERHPVLKKGESRGVRWRKLAGMTIGL